MSLFYNSAKAVVAPAIRLLWRPRISGVENVPRTGGFLIVSNHLANVDSFLIPLALPRPVRYVSKDDFWKKPGLKGRIIRWFFTAVDAVPLDREALSSGRGALDAGLTILREGDGFGIYPEGHRSKDGLLHEGRPGAAWLALESGCPIVPVGLKGTELLFRDGWWPKPGLVTIRIGTPFTVDDIAPEQPKGARRRAVTTRIMDEIQALSGQARAEAPARSPRNDT